MMAVKSGPIMHTVIVCAVLQCYSSPPNLRISRVYLFSYKIEIVQILLYICKSKKNSNKN